MAQTPSTSCAGSVRLQSVQTSQILDCRCAVPSPIGIIENKNGNYYSILGIYWHNGKENGNSGRMHAWKSSAALGTFLIRRLQITKCR